MKIFEIIFTQTTHSRPLYPLEITYHLYTQNQTQPDVIFYHTSDSSPLLVPQLLTYDHPLYSPLRLPGSTTNRDSSTSTQHTKDLGQTYQQLDDYPATIKHKAQILKTWWPFLPESMNPVFQFLLETTHNVPHTQFSVQGASQNAVKSNARKSNTKLS